MKNSLYECHIDALPLVHRGKVREVYDAGDHFMMVCSDRLSAFDVIMNQPIPLKGKILNSISAFWFERTKNLVKNHMVSTNLQDYPESCLQYDEQLAGRSMLVKKLKMLPIECIVRGYISGSGWNDYVRTGSVCGTHLPAGLIESEKLPEPIFTPSTKAALGTHDENISELEAERLVGTRLYEEVRNAAISIFKESSEYALSKGIILADTKMEFGIDEESHLTIGDELLTPDSSRFWDLKSYNPGGPQESYDKQFVRDYLLSVQFNKKPPPPDLPEEIIANTAMKYKEAYYLLTGQTV